MAWSWARRSLAAATIFMALVIFCVDWTLRILSRKVLRLGMGSRRPLRELLGEVGQERLQLVVRLLDDLALVADRRQHRAFGAQRVEHVTLEIADAVDRQVVEEAAGARVDRRDLLFDRHRLVLALLQELGQPLATRQQALGRGVEGGGELGERAALAGLRATQP